MRAALYMLPLIPKVGFIREGIVAGIDVFTIIPVYFFHLPLVSLRLDTSIVFLNILLVLKKEIVHWRCSVWG